MEFRRKANVNMQGLGAVEVYEMNGRAFVEWQRSQEENVSPVAIAAAVLVHCVPLFDDKEPDELLEMLTPNQLSDLFVAVIDLSEIETAKNSEAEASYVSSVS